MGGFSPLFREPKPIAPSIHQALPYGKANNPACKNGFPLEMFVQMFDAAFERRLWLIFMVVKVNSEHDLSKIPFSLNAFLFDRYDTSVWRKKEGDTEKHTSY